MKLDLNYIKQLLDTINNCDDDRVCLEYVFDIFNIKDNDENDLSAKKVRHHLFLLHDAGFLNSSDNNLGFYESLDGIISCNFNTTYWLTIEGYKLLESLNNDKLFNKLTTGIKNIGIDTLKQIPALALQYLMTHC